jgi:hypothetical protein
MREHLWHSFREVNFGFPRLLCPPDLFPKVRSGHLAQKLVRRVERSKALLSVLFNEDLAYVLDKLCWEVQDAKGALTAETRGPDQRFILDRRKVTRLLTFLVLLLFAFFPFLFDLLFDIVLLIRRDVRATMVFLEASSDGRGTKTVLRFVITR